jgi:hypothetical protein
MDDLTPLQLVALAFTGDKDTPIDVLRAGAIAVAPQLGLPAPAAE